LSCAYDIESLATGVIAGAYETHRFVRRGGEMRTTRGHVEAARLFQEALPAAPAHLDQLAFDDRSLVNVRRFVGHHAAPGLDAAAAHDLVLAADELATNSVRHGGGSGLLRIWHDRTHVVCEVTDLLVGCRRPGPRFMHGCGLWLVNQLCDLVQIRSSSAGTVVRVHKRYSSSPVPSTRWLQPSSTRGRS
jgi:anti-sigma regulatory factor (Ser/Thr protein kinase)